MGQRKGKQEEKKVQCRQCEASFFLYNDLKDHWKQVHEGKWVEVVQYIENTKHVGEVNE